MTWIVIAIIYYLGVVGCLLLALTHRGTWPYIPTSESRKARRRTLLRFWVGRVAIAFAWPGLIVVLGVVAVYGGLLT